MRQYSSNTYSKENGEEDSSERVGVAGCVWIHRKRRCPCHMVIPGWIWLCSYSCLLWWTEEVMWGPMVTEALPGGTSRIFVIFLHIVTGQSCTSTPTFPFWQWNSLKYEKENWNVLCFRLRYQQEKAFSLWSTYILYTCEKDGVRWCQEKSVRFTHNKVDTKKILYWDYKISISFEIAASVHKPRISGRKQSEQSENQPRLWILAEVQVSPK